MVAGMLNEPPERVEACYVQEHDLLRAVLIWQRRYGKSKQCPALQLLPGRAANGGVASTRIYSAAA